MVKLRESKAKFALACGNSINMDGIKMNLANVQQLTVPSQGYAKRFSQFLLRCCFFCESINSCWIFRSFRVDTAVGLCPSVSTRSIITGASSTGTSVTSPPTPPRSFPRDTSNRRRKNYSVSKQRGKDYDNISKNVWICERDKKADSLIIFLLFAFLCFVSLNRTKHFRSAEWQQKSHHEAVCCNVMRGSSEEISR